MDTPINVYFFIVPVIVFGPLFLWIFYNFGLKELIKIPGEMRRKRTRDTKADIEFEAERVRKRGTGEIWLVRGPNKSVFGFFMQGITFIWFAVLIGFFASSPPYLYRSPEMALIKLSLNHAGQRLVECSKRTATDLAKLEPNMRAKVSCPRERWPVHVELMLGDETIFSEEAKPAGFSSDGPSSFYETFIVPAGLHRLTLRLRDKGDSGFSFEATQEIKIMPRQVVAAQFDPTKGGFVIK